MPYFSDFLILTSVSFRGYFEVILGEVEVVSRIYLLYLDCIYKVLWFAILPYFSDFLILTSVSFRGYFEVICGVVKVVLGINLIHIDCTYKSLRLNTLCYTLITFYFDLCQF